MKIIHNKGHQKEYRKISKRPKHICIKKQKSKSSAWEVLAGCPRNVRHQAILYVTKIPSSFYFRLENWALGFGQSLWETARAATRFDAIQKVVFYDSPYGKLFFPNSSYYIVHTTSTIRPS